MTDMGAYERDDDLAVAAEYVLGLLEPLELRAFETRLGVDPELRALVALWSEDMVALAQAVPSVAPPARLESALMRRLFPEAERDRSWLRRLGLWPLLAGAAAAALLLWTVAPAVLPGAEAGPAYAATITAEDGSMLILARYEPEAGAVSIERQAGEAPAGRVLELWIIPDGGAPVSLGVLPEAGTVEMPVPDAYREGFPAGILAITDEPPGGGPGGNPSGSVLASGPIITL